MAADLQASNPYRGHPDASTGISPPQPLLPALTTDCHPTHGAPSFQVVPFRALFRFATRLDVALNAVALVAALANGAVFPLFTVVFRALLDAFNSPADFPSAISRFSLYFLLLAIGAGILTFVEITLPLFTSERQMRILRARFMAALLRQEAGWHDTNRVGERTGRGGGGGGGGGGLCAPALARILIPCVAQGRWPAGWVRTRWRWRTASGTS
jgi:hypothetical protein